MDVSAVFLIVGILPSLGIFYFSYANWPLAYNLQIDYFVLLLITFIIAIGYFVTTPSSGGRNSNPIGYVGAIIPMFLFILPVIFCIGGISLFYKGLPAGEPGIPHIILKWSFLIIAIPLFLATLYGIIEKNYIKAMMYTPDTVRHYLYSKLIASENISTKAYYQLENTIAKIITTKERQNDLLLLSKIPNILNHILTDGFGNTHYVQVEPSINTIINDNRVLVARTACRQSNIKQDPEFMSDILNDLAYQRYDYPEPVILSLLDCADIEKLNVFRGMISENENFIRTIWFNYPSLRPYYYFTNGDKHIGIIKEIKEKKQSLGDIKKILKNLDNFNDLEKDHIKNYDALYTYLMSIEN